MRTSCHLKFLVFVAFFLLVVARGGPVVSSDGPPVPRDIGELQEEFPKELRAIDVGILRWREELEFSLDFRFTQRLGRIPSGNNLDEPEVLTLADIKRIMHKHVVDSMSSSYPMQATGHVYKSRKAFRYRFEAEQPVLGIEPFDAGMANGVSVEVCLPHGATGRPNPVDTVFRLAKTPDGLTRFPNRASAVPMPMLGFSAVGPRFFQSELRKGDPPTHRFFWGVKRDDGGRITVVQRRRKLGDDGQYHVIQQWEVTLRRGAKYPVIEECRYWTPDGNGKLVFSGYVRHAGFQRTANGLLFPTRVIATDRARFRGDMFVDNRNASKVWWIVRTWEAVRFVGKAPEAESFRIELAPGSRFRGYHWPSDRRVIRLEELDPKKLDGNFVGKVAGRRAAGRANQMADVSSDAMERPSRESAISPRGLRFLLLSAVGATIGIGLLAIRQLRLGGTLPQD